MQSVGDKLLAGDLTIEARQSEAGAPLHLYWSGKSTDRRPGIVLDPYFAEMLQLASAESVPLELHFETLDYLNSSTIAAIIRMIESSRAHRVKLTVVFDKSLRWQKLSFEALRVFVRDDSLLDLRPVESHGAPSVEGG